MTGKTKARLAHLGIELPLANPPVANFVPVKKVGNLLFISGQVPKKEGRDHYVGKLGAQLEIEEGKMAARLCALNVLAQLDLYLEGELDRVVQCVRLGGYVNAIPDFGSHPQVIDGASELLVEIFGDAGKHSRTAIGVGSLPRNVSVELDAIFEIC